MQLLPFELGGEAGTRHSPAHVGPLGPVSGAEMGGAAKPQAARKMWNRPLAEASLEGRSKIKEAEERSK